MQSKNKRSGDYTSPSLIKYIAMVIALCYLINPLNRQISIVIHEVSHALEMPSTVIGHAVSPELASTHHSHNHDHLASKHEHLLIKIFDAVFDASDASSDAEDHVLLDFKFDKHLSVFNEIHIDNFIIPVFANYKRLPSKLKIGYSSKIDQPPRNTPSPNFT